jgi:hypothetical protein
MEGGLGDREDEAALGEKRMMIAALAALKKSSEHKSMGYVLSVTAFWIPSLGHRC